MDKQPLVTVYIPTFNRVELLKRAVESVQNQTYQNLEIIIVDDCSTDGTHNYLEQLAKEDKRVRYFLKEINSGACVSRNIAIENATGEFITGLDDDDLFMKYRIEKFVKNKTLLSKYIFLSSKYFYKINFDYDYKSKNSFFVTKEVKKEDLLFNNILGNQIFIKTEVLRKNLFNQNLLLWQDLYCWYMILKNNDGIGLIIDNYSYVIDVSHDHERITKKKKDRAFETYKKFCDDFYLNDKEKRILFCQLEHYGYNVSFRDLLYAWFYSFDFRTTYITLTRVYSKFKSIFM